MSRAGALPILMYHHVSPAPGLVTVSPQTFRSHMAWMARNGYRSAGCDDVAAFLAGKDLPEKSVVITFDDGYLDNFIHAHPVLAEFGFKAVLFLVTGWTGDGPVRHAAATPDHGTCMARVKAGNHDEVMLRWSEVDVMRAAGTFEFHSHTHSHTRWDRVETDIGMRRTHLADDLAASRASLKARLGSDSSHLCWPQGYFDDDYVEVAQSVGFRYLYTVEKGMALPASDALRLPRIVVKDRGDGWLGRRLEIYRRPWLGRLYAGLRGA